MPIPPVETDNFVQDEGESVRHLKAVLCPCQDETGRPDPNCKKHEAGGYQYLDERFLIGLITGIENNETLMKSGLFLPGDCIFSPLSDEKIGERDKIIFTWPLPYLGEVNVRSDVDDFDTLFYSAQSVSLCLDEDDVRYVEGRDFYLDGKKIIWDWQAKESQGVAPAAGKRYSVRYMAYVEWLAFIPPATRISNGEDIGDKVFLRKRHLVER